MFILETERLALRRLTPADLPEVKKLLQDPVVMYAYEGALDDEESADWLYRQMARYQRDGFGLWGMIERTGQCMIGQCGITLQDYKGIQVAEIGYLLRKEHWHKGYATEAAKACKVYAFERLGLDKVYSIIRDTNVASQQVALRNGMQPVDCITKHYRGVDMPHIVYCIER